MLNMSLAMRDGIGGNDGAESTSATETGAGTGRLWWCVKFAIRRREIYEAPSLQLAANWKKMRIESAAT